MRALVFTFKLYAYDRGMFAIDDLKLSAYKLSPYMLVLLEYLIDPLTFHFFASFASALMANIDALLHL